MRSISLAILSLMLPVFASVSQAVTDAPRAVFSGFDDYNVSTLRPYPAAYITALPVWFNLALLNSATQDNVGWSFNDPAQWKFTPADSPVDSSRIVVFNYTAWVVSQDPYNLPNGQPATLYPFNNADVGGANFTFNYEPTIFDPGGPRGSDISLTDVHFLQVVRTVSNYGDDATGFVAQTTTRYFIDNGSINAVPWYDAKGAHGNAGPNDTQKWMDDSPFRCENQGAGGCSADGMPNLLSIEWEADTFIAVDQGEIGGTQHFVSLYGGRNWGFIYTNDEASVPEIDAA